MNGQSFQELWDTAEKAGKEAARVHEVVPMVVVEADLFDRPLPGAKPEFVADGVCGLAWVEVRPASSVGRRDCELVKWLRRNKIGSYDEYRKCWSVAIHDYNQCMQRKEAHAEAMAKVLRDRGFNARARAWMD